MYRYATLSCETTADIYKFFAKFSVYWSSIISSSIISSSIISSSIISRGHYLFDI